MTAGATETAPGETVTHAVRCADLTYSFGTHTAVDHVDLSIEPGEMFGLPGPNGAGKPSPGLRHFFAWGQMVSGRGCAGAAAGGADSGDDHEQDAGRGRQARDLS